MREPRQPPVPRVPMRSMKINVTPMQLQDIDAWRLAQPSKPKRATAIRILVLMGLLATSRPETILARR